jgi:hypothetical protein
LLITEGEYLLTSTTEKKQKPSMFQVLLLDNNPSQDVSVHEADHVDFSQVKQHLQNGGSVFITSTDTQKIQYPKPTPQTKYVNARRNMGLFSISK